MLNIADSGFLVGTQIHAKERVKETANLHNVHVAEENTEQESNSNKGKKGNIGRQKSLLKMNDAIQGNIFLLYTYW